MTASVTSMTPATRVRYRVATSVDQDAQVRFWNSLSAESIYSRFFNGNRNAYQRLSTDPSKRTVVLAELGGLVVGLGELIAHGDGRSAEVAFAVLDGHQGKGIALRLLADLTHLARGRGLSRLTATVLPFNRAMLSVFRRSGLPCEVRHRHDVVEVTLQLRESLAA